MRQPAEWKPSKFVKQNGRLYASRDTSEVAVSSRLTADIIANAYFRHLPSHAKGDLLDLGCGKIPLFESYRDLTRSSTCADWPNSLHANPFLDIACDINYNLPFVDSVFDTVILSDVLEHVYRPSNLCLEINRVLRSRGKLIMNVPFLYWIHEQPHDYYRYTEFALRRLIQESGLKLITFENLGGAPEVLTDIFAKNLSGIPMFGGTISNLVQGLTAMLLKTRVGRKVSTKTSHKFPLGYFLVAEKC